MAIAATGHSGMGAVIQIVGNRHMAIAASGIQGPRQVMCRTVTITAFETAVNAFSQCGISIVTLVA